MTESKEKVKNGQVLKLDPIKKGHLTRMPHHKRRKREGN
jgi:hypothetical protein